MSLRGLVTVLLAASCTLLPGEEEPDWPMYTPVGDADTDNDTDDTDTVGDTDTDIDPPSDPVGVGFVGTVATVSGTPFGLGDEVRTTTVTGLFTYDLGVPDDLWTDPLNSKFDHQGWDSPFLIFVGGKSITGSRMPVVTIELFSHTFRWVDGPQLLDESEFRTCFVDGVPDPEIQLHLAVVPDDGFVPFLDDSLPADFPYIGIDLSETSITFSVGDAGGTLLMQLEAFTDTDGSL